MFQGRVVLVVIVVIVTQGILYRTPEIIGKQAPTGQSSCFALKGAYFLIMTRDVLYIIPPITRLLGKTKTLLHTVCLFTIDLLPLPAFVVLISREIVKRQRR